MNPQIWIVRYQVKNQDPVVLTAYTTEQRARDACQQVLNAFTPPGQKRERLTFRQTKVLGNVRATTMDGFIVFDIHSRFLNGLS